MSSIPLIHPALAVPASTAPDRRSPVTADRTARAAVLDRLPSRLERLAALGWPSTAVARFERALRAMHAAHPGVADAVLDADAPAPAATATAGVGPTHAIRASLRPPVSAIVGGVGDGAVLGTLPSSRATDELGRGASVVVCEPDASVLGRAMLAVDLDAPDGPILGGHVAWCVGPDWSAAAVALATAEPFRPLPAHAVVLTVPAGELARIREDAAAAREAMVLAGREHIDARCRRVSDAELARRLRDAGPSLRVLLLASRFTTVLRHQVEDLRASLSELGAEVTVLMERAACERLGEAALARAVAETAPDLVITIDSLRHEHRCLPPSLCFAGWIQDDLAHLRAAGMGERLGPRSFVLGTWTSRYVREHGYPAERCIALPRLTRAAALPSVAPPASADEIVYVSNHGVDPEARLRSMIRAACPGTASARVLERVGRGLIDAAAADRLPRTARELHPAVRSAAEDESVHAITDAAVSELAESLLLELVNPLYRQQGVRWAIELAAERGLRVGLHGASWAGHPEFAPFARGPVEPGPALAALTRAATVSLQLEPYAPATHQRLIDGLAAGGFFASRLRWSHELAEDAWARFLLDRVPADVSTLAAARAARAPEDRDELERLRDRMVEAFPIFRERDVVEHFRLRGIDGTLELFEQAPLPPRFDETSFVDRAGLARVIDHALEDPAWRSEVAAVQRRFVLERFDHRTGVRRVLSAIADRLDPPDDGGPR